jgi:hypothetical protein
LTFLRLIPVLLSFLLLAAHFLRSGNLILIGLCLALPLVLLVRRPGSARLVQVALVLGGLEWARSLWVLASRRAGAGEPWLRMALILGAVGLLTILSVLVFRHRSLRRRYSLGGSVQDQDEQNQGHEVAGHHRPAEPSELPGGKTEGGH